MPPTGKTGESKFTNAMEDAANCAGESFASRIRNAITSANEDWEAEQGMTDLGTCGRPAEVNSVAMQSDIAAKNIPESDAEHLARLKREVLVRKYMLPANEVQWLVQYADRLEAEAWQAREVLRRG